MKATKEHILNRFAFFFFTLAVLGQFLAEYAKAVPSIAMIGYILCGVAGAVLSKGKIQANRELIILSAGFILLYLTQYLNSDDLGYLNERIQIKIPLMLMPIASAFIGPFSRNDLTRIGVVFIAVCACSALFITFRFFLNYAYYIDLIKKSQIVPGPINHIRFSIMCTVAVVLALFYLKHPMISWKKWEQIALWSAILFLVCFIHFYAVRSGILALYAVLFFLLVKKVLQTKRVFLRIAYILFFISIPFIAYFSSNAVRSKIEATKADYTLYKNNGYNNFNSLGKRLFSYEIAFIVLKEHPWVGCGIGDLEKTNLAWFHQLHPEIEYIIIPHNQFIYYLMGSGILGTLLFAITFFYPLVKRGNYRHFLVAMIYLILFLSFQTEPMLETQLGVAFTVIFLLYAWGWKQIDADVATDIT